MVWMLFGLAYRIHITLEIISLEYTFCWAANDSDKRGEPRVVLLVLFNQSDVVDRVTHLARIGYSIISSPFKSI